MIEVKTKLIKNLKHYLWTCSLCTSQGEWLADFKKVLDDGAVHAKTKHPVKTESKRNFDQWWEAYNIFHNHKIGDAAWCAAYATWCYLTQETPTRKK